MDEPQYHFSPESLDISYTFDSISDRKTVHKVVRFTETDLPDVFNLALLDLMDDGQESDLSVTNNADLRIVLATVMQIINHFLLKFSDKIVTFQGSDDRRTRLYRLVIGKELPALQQLFEIAGQYADGSIERFRPNQTYIRFFVQLKR
jgi:hypothetical protein